MTGTTDYLNIWGGFDMESLGTPPRDLDGLTRQALWEGAALARSARAYHLRSQEADAKGVGQGTDYGAEIIRRLVPRVIERVRVIQDEAADADTRRGNKVATPGVEIVMMLEATPAALIAVSETLGACLQDGGDTQTTRLATRIMGAIRDDMDCRAWLNRKDDPASSQTAEAEDRLRRRFLKTYPNPTRRQWLSWARRIEARTAINSWGNADKIVAGALLLREVVDAGDVFILTQGSLKAPSTISLSEDAKRRIENFKGRRATMAPRLLPMLIKPLDWAAD